MTQHPLIRWTLAATLMACLSLSWALPSPKDIESALNAGHTAQAEGMLREVIKEKPDSAKAHYELGQVLAREARYDQALAELRQAQSIDPKLGFARSPEQFERIVAEVKELDAKRALAPSAPVVHSPVAPARAEPALPMSTVWWGIGALFVMGLVLLLMRRRDPVPAPMTTVVDAPRGFGAGYNPAPPMGYPPQPMGYPPTGGSGLGGAVVGGLAGMAAGYALAKATEGGSHAVAGTLNPDQGGYVPFDQSPGPQLDAFDSGSGGDSWDSGGSDMSSGDDQW
jgi:tetratricopeptide (TPR) repeat protein